MHVGLNAQLMARPGTYRGAGISGYIGGLLGSLPEAAPEMRFTAWLPEVRTGLEGIQQSPSAFAGRGVLHRILWEQTAWATAARRAGVDLLHGLAFSLPIASSLPAVVTFFDMSFLLFPRYHPAGRRLYLRWITGRAARKAQAVIAISASTKRDIVRLLGIEEGKIEVIPLAAGEAFRPLSQEGRERFRWDRGLNPYIYYQGTIEPRKNVVTLIQAYGQLRMEGYRGHDLVIGGAPGWDHDEAWMAVQRLGLRKQVHFLGYVTPEESPWWYGAADVFVYPSEYEGFGLPPLEAMSCGTPVVVADSSSLPEVVGDAGVLVPPRDADALAQAIAELIENPGLRASLADRGLERARSFTWKATARATARLYSRCLG